MRFNLLLNTVSYLKPIQIRYRLKYFIRNRIGKSPLLTDGASLPKSFKSTLKIRESIFNRKSYIPDNGFRFLNIEHNFYGKIDWNYPEYGRLWTYNLNYFDFLYQEGISADEGLNLIDDYIEIINDNYTGLEPYPNFKIVTQLF